MKLTLFLLGIAPVLHAQGTQPLNEPRWSKVHHLDSLGEHLKAERLLTELANEPHHRYQALLTRARVRFFELDKHKEAFEDVSELVSTAPDSLAPWLNRSNLYLSLGMPDRALGDLKEALSRCQRRDDSVSVHLNSGAAMAGLRRFQEAVDLADRALELDPDNVEAAVNKAIALGHLGRTEEGDRIMQELHRRDTADIVILNNLGFNASHAGRHEQAIHWFEKARVLRPDDAVVLNNLGYALLNTGRALEALDLVERSIVISPGNSYAYRNLGLIRLALGESDKACDAWEMALERGFTQRFGPEVDRLHREHCH